MVAAEANNSKRIAKNTMMLYIRQILVMLITLFTVRVVLEVLGVVDYGIFNVVGGVVAMFSFLSGTMSSASQRYFAYDLGRKDYVSLGQTFSLTIISYMAIALLVLVVCESLGIWFLNNKMVIPPDRLEAANWVFQAAILSAVVTIMTSPYMAVIIARERMGAYAYITILDVVLKLAIIYVIQWIDYDKLKVYSILTLCNTAVIALIYRLYCIKNFEESHYRFYWNYQRLKEMLSYVGWNLIGAAATILKLQGVNILLNLFFNPAVNAARAVAFQINSAVFSFSQNFYTAVKPQITKSYSSGNHEHMLQLISKSSLYAFYLISVIVIPIYFQIDAILAMWLTEVPPYAVIFTKITLITAMVDIFNFPLVAGIQATGRIKGYQLVVSIIYLMNLPICYILLRVGYPPQSTMWVSLALSLLSFIPRLIIARNIFKLSIRNYMQTILTRGGVMLLILIIIAYIASYICFDNIFIFGLIYLLLSVVSIYILGLNSEERAFTLQLLKIKGVIQR